MFVVREEESVSSEDLREIVFIHPRAKLCDLVYLHLFTPTDLPDRLR
jgi:hypothetical protein